MQKIHIKTFLILSIMVLIAGCAGPSAYRAARDAGMSRIDSLLWSIPPR